MLATTSVLGVGSAYFRPVAAYANPACSYAFSSGTVSGQHFQYYVIDAAINASCTSLTLTASSNVDVVVGDDGNSLSLSDSGLDIIGTGVGEITFTPYFGFTDSLLLIEEGTVSISGVTFEGADSSSDFGGAIRVYDEYAGFQYQPFSIISIDDVSFVNNVAPSGGAVFVGFGSVTISNSTFTNNEADQDDGGAIFIGFGTLDVSDSTFTGNTATGEGGAIYMDDVNWVPGAQRGVTASFDNVDFVNNSAYDGGAIYSDNYFNYYGPSSNYISFISNSTFTGNQATGDNQPYSYYGDGGAVSTSGDIGAISNSVFTGNSSVNDGGAIEADDISTIEGSTFHDNYAGDDGGAIEADDIDLINSSTFTDNESDSDGGAIEADDINLISSSTFSGNVAASNGGAIEADDIETINSSTFTSNQAGNDGGAIEMDDDLDLYDSTFTSNTAGGAGGAIEADDIGTIEGAVFNGNEAGNDGGAIEADHINAVYASDFSSNSSQDMGGAIQSWTIDHIVATDFEDNSAYYDGGAIEGDTILTISESTFINNSTEEDGGAIEADDVNYISASLFIGNEAEQDGGAIEASLLAIRSTTFAYNSALSDGGAIDAFELNLVENSTFFNNIASSNGRAININGQDLSFSTDINNTTIWSTGDALNQGDSEVFSTLPLSLDSSVIANSEGDDSVILYSAVAFAANYSFLSGVNLVEFADWGSNNLEGSDPGLGIELLEETEGTPHLPVLRPMPTSVLGNAGNPTFTGFGEGIPVLDQRGLDRVVGGRIDIGAVELLSSEIQEAGPAIPVADYSIPTSVSLTPRTAAPGQSATISGPGTTNIIRVRVAGQDVSFTRQSDGRISFAVPTGLKPGVYEVEMTLDLGQIVTREKITISGAIKARNLLYTNFVGDRSVLPSSARSGISAALAGFKNVTKVVCIGSTSGTTATAADRRLAQQRAQAACNLVKRIRPDLVVELRTRPASGVGARFRSVTIQIQGS